MGDEVKMYLVKNISEQEQSIVAIGNFLPGEVKEVSENKRNRLLRNPHFADVTEEPVLTEVTGNESNASDLADDIEDVETPKKKTAKK